MTKLKIFFTLIATLLLLIGTGTAKDIYKWVDENGVLHFQDTPPQNATQPVSVESAPTYEDNPRNVLKPKQASVSRFKDHSLPFEAIRKKQYTAKGRALRHQLVHLLQKGPCFL